MSSLQTFTSLENGNQLMVGLNNNFALLNQGTASTTNIYIDGNRQDTYTAVGSVAYPYKTISAAIAGINLLSYANYVIYINPATYVESGALTFPNVGLVIYGNGDTLVCPSGMTLSNAFDCYDLTIVGNIIQSDTSITTVHNFSSGFLSGNLTISGLCALQGMATQTSILTAIANVITINAGAQLTVQNSSIGARIINNGILYFDGSDIVRNDNTNYLITSTASTSILYMSGDKLINYGTGGGINCSGVQSGYSNEISTIDVIVGGSTNAITCGSALTSMSNYNGIDSANGNPVPATGTVFTAPTNAYLQLQGFATTSAPTYAKGAIYFDTTLNKLRIGGVSGFETITSS